MSANEEIRTTLLDMGISADKAREAAVRYNTIEAALNWVFGEGENWTPSSAGGDVLPSYGDYAWDATGVGMGPALGSNNPFANTAPPPPPPRRKIQEDEEDELRRALEISKAADAAERDKRAERERSVRASAPPPSPGRTEEGGVTFGPSNKNDPDNQLAVTLAKASDNKEEEDFQRAIQESMMTASFHSVGSESVELPPPQERTPGAPVVFLTSQQPTFAAHVLQALAAVPQLRDVFAHLEMEHEDPQHLVMLHEAFRRQAEEPNNYVVVDDYVRTLHQTWEVHSTSLPPLMAILDKYIPGLHAVLVNAAGSREEMCLLDERPSDFFTRPDQLLATRLHSVPMVLQHHVQFDRTFSAARSFHDCMAAALWTPENPGESIEQLADVVFVALRRMPGVAAAKWELDEEVVLDRYLTCNAPWSAQIRAKQAVVQGELRRLKEQVERLTTFKENNIPDAIQVLITHLGTKPVATKEDGSDGSEQQALEERQDLKEKLERIQNLMKAKVDKLQEAIAQHEAEASGALFETDDPAKNENRYLLRAILWHDGFLTPGKHLYAYIRNDDGWWRVQDELASKVTWDEIQADTTGQFTDGGPYLLVYSRDGPRPLYPGSTLVSQPAPHEDLMDIDMDDTTTIGSSGDADGTQSVSAVFHHPATGPNTPMDARHSAPAAPAKSLIDEDTEGSETIRKAHASAKVPPPKGPRAPSPAKSTFASRPDNSPSATAASRSRPTSPVKSPAAPAAPGSHSHPTSPVKSAVKGPRPLLSKSSSSSFRDDAREAQLVDVDSINASPDKKAQPLVDLTSESEPSAATAGRRASTTSQWKPSGEGKKDADDDLLM